MIAKIVLPTWLYGLLDEGEVEVDREYECDFQIPGPDGLSGAYYSRARLAVSYKRSVGTSFISSQDRHKPF